jgi:septal ring-binding cell division protein DamX
VGNQIQDDGFHEIQLNGKQLVFLFMAATVVSVVIFLCGVLVGRGVRAERGLLAEGSATAAPVEPVPEPAPAQPAPTPAGSDPTAAPAPPAAEDLSYFQRLEKQNAPKEQLKAGAAHAAPAPEKESKQPPAPKVAAAPPQTAPPTAAEPSGSGYAVQIAALNIRSEADAIAKRLSSKGYSAYVLAPANGTPSVFRVRVGKFPTKREAETVAAKLRKEEQFNPWVTR